MHDLKTCVTNLVYDYYGGVNSAFSQNRSLLEIFLKRNTVLIFEATFLAIMSFSLLTLEKLIRKKKVFTKKKKKKNSTAIVL